MTAAFLIRAVVIAIGAGLFFGSEFVDVRNAKKPYATGRDRAATFYDDMKVGIMRLAGVGLVVLALLSVVIQHHLAP